MVGEKSNEVVALYIIETSSFFLTVAIASITAADGVFQGRPEPPPGNGVVCGRGGGARKNLRVLLPFTCDSLVRT